MKSGTTHSLTEEPADKAAKRGHAMALLEFNLLNYRLEVAFGIFGSIIFSVLLIFINKHLVQTYSFTAMATLTGWHVSFTWIMIFSSIRIGLVEYKAIPYRVAAAYSCGNAVAMALQNLSLAQNSISTYQVSKLLIIPATIIINVCRGDSFPRPAIILSLFILLLGIGLATVNDVEMRLSGGIIACLSVVATACVTTYTHLIQKMYNISSNQFLASYLSTQAIIMLIFGPAFDRSFSGKNPYTEFDWSYPSVQTIGSSCFVAVGVNVFACFLLGKTSAVAFQVVGHLKTIIILSGGYLFFDHDTSMKVVAGGCVAMGTQRAVIPFC
mmetsp:Transcript_1365/g.3179  ORF Transcript_1365/g.3179 Transcript_1365/m.3179 type:complete len:326 (-) Transcript_1365:1513-2490(-)